MTMRGHARRAFRVDVQGFGWDRAAVATLRHSTLPWHEEFAPVVCLDATPLSALDDLGSRDRLSLTGQYAAHLSFLQFAGIRDADFDPGAWVVARKRGVDCRLVRISARCADEPPPVLTSIQQFASRVGAPKLEVLRQSWGRAENVYHEVHSQLRADVAADLRWLRCASSGSIAAPGGEWLRALPTHLATRFLLPADLTAFRALATIDTAVVILGDDASPLVRFSAIRPFAKLIGALDALNETGIVERVVSVVGGSRRVFVITNPDAFDDASRRVLDLLVASGLGLWIGDEGLDLPETSWFLISPRLEARRDLDVRLASIPAASRRGWIEKIAQSPALDRYLDHGELPVVNNENVMRRLREPFRSYTAAVSLLGRRVSESLVNDFLRRLLSTAKAADLVIEGVSAIQDGQLMFVSDDVRQEAMRSIPSSSHSSLCRVAAEVAEAHGELRSAAVLFTEAGDLPRAAAIFEAVKWRSADEVIATLRSFPRAALSEKLAAILAEALVASGRYRDGRPTASGRLLAQIERRTGEYGAALDRLERLGAKDFESELLRAELLRLLDRHEEAATALAGCEPVNDQERVRHGYQSAVLANETDTTADDSWLIIEAPCRDYYAARIGVYRAIKARDLDAAVSNARSAVILAGSIADRVDATLDLLFTLFCCGDWPAARSAALDALLLVEETQGDRAAGGILFLLACLLADDGQWTHATHLLERLRRFYSDVHDRKRLVELELIAAMIDLSRGRFRSAERAAKAALAVSTSDQIREEAALILDEIDWIEDRQSPLRSTGATANVELTDRHKLLRARRGDRVHVRSPFAVALLEWEKHGGPPPTAANGSQKLMLFRAALGCGCDEVASSIAAELKITVDSPSEWATESELRVLRAASALPFPFSPQDFVPTGWRYATRNRLGQWHEIGSLPQLSSRELDAVLAEPSGDWIACSDRELLQIEDVTDWTSESRDAIAALFRVRAEHHRLRRLMDEETTESTATIEGVVGQSAAMRDVYDLVGRVAKRDVAICVLGESGTGKELIARSIHRQSTRRQKPFTPINCAALPENLIESELFGHVRGAFTGADRDRPGLIETTDGGTLFLDEIGEMPLPAQAKLLRFLQEGEFRRVGETVNRLADVRVVAATNRKLEAAVEDGRFREDLYYRIRGVEIVMPPLRDRGSDIALLGAHFLAVERQKHRGGPMRLSTEAEAAFASYHWPGNVRELQNTIRGAHALAGDAREIDLEHLPGRLRGIKIVRTPLGSYHDAVARFRRELIEKSLAQAQGNQNKAASMLKISRQALAYQIRELGILVTPSKRPTP